MIECEQLQWDLNSGPCDPDPNTTTCDFTFPDLKAGFSCEVLNVTLRERFQITDV